MSQAGEGCANRHEICLQGAGFSNLETLSRYVDRKGGASQGTSEERGYEVYHTLENSNNSYLFNLHTPLRGGIRGQGLEVLNRRGFLALLKHRLYTPNTTTGKECRTIGIRAAGSIRAAPEEAGADTSPWP